MIPLKAALVLSALALIAAFCALLRWIAAHNHADAYEQRRRANQSFLDNQRLAARAED